MTIPGLKYFIKRRISKLISSQLVFPNKIPLKLSKSLDAAELKSVEPEVNYKKCTFAVFNFFVVL